LAIWVASNSNSCWFRNVDVRNTLSKIEIDIRKMEASDVEALMHIKNAENWNQTEQDWYFLMEHDPEYCLVAVVDDRVAGSVTAINYHNKTAWIGMMLVVQEYRGMGISKMLLNTIIRKLKDCKSIKLDATPAGIPVYRKLGFVEEYEISRMTSASLTTIEGGLNGESHLRKAFDVMPITKSTILEIANKDEGYFGVNRLELMQYQLLDQNNICLQLNLDHKLNGYVFGRSGSNYLQVGPLMGDSFLGVEFLLRRVFTQLKGLPLVVDVLSDKQELIDWLGSIGFDYQRTFTRMYLKSNDFSGEPDKQFFICGPEFG